MSPSVPTGSELTEVAEVTARIRRSIGTVLSGLDHAISAMLATVLAQGHLLMEDVPGVGKTTLARAFAASVDCSVGRLQFTPDLLPSDVTGVSIYRSDEHRFEFRPGPVFANVVIADEINRASPKTQSALLESMQEGSVTVDGFTRELPQPFLVVATQNPIEMEGTYPLPEAQRDRFMAQVAVGYPSPRSELAMLDSHDGVDPLDALRPVTDIATLSRAIGVAQRIYVAPALKQYMVDLVSATRTDPALRLGASPRATIQLQVAVKARAAMGARTHALPDDVKALAVPVLAHRLVLSTEARLAGRTATQVVRDLVAAIPVPGVAREALSPDQSSSDGLRHPVATTG